jgi:hypothetical protein
LSNGYLRWHGGDTELEQAMLAIVLEYSKLLLLFVLIGSVVTLSRFGARQSRQRAPSSSLKI